MSNGKATTPTAYPRRGKCAQVCIGFVLSICALAYFKYARTMAQFEQTLEGGLELHVWQVKLRQPNYMPRMWCSQTGFEDDPRKWQRQGQYTTPGEIQRQIRWGGQASKSGQTQRKQYNGCTSIAGGNCCAGRRHVQDAGWPGNPVAD
eukprot:2969044-Amphidinium_carterae.1